MRLRSSSMPCLSNADRTIPAYVYGNPDHYSALPDSENRNPLAITDRDAVGYSDNRNLAIRNNLEVRYEPKWLKGLAISATGAYDFSNYRQDDLTKLLYLYDYWTDEQTGQPPRPKPFPLKAPNTQTIITNRIM